MATVEEMKRMLAGYDTQLDVLSDTSKRMLENSKQICQELKSQIEIIKDTNDKMDDVQEAQNKALVTLEDIQKHKPTCISWILSVVFLILIFVVVFAWDTDETKA